MSFENGKDFFSKLEHKLPDLILLDLMLPDQSGNDIVKKLRQRSATKRIPVIMVTAKTTELDLIKGLEDGADDYIKKPFSVMELISRVKALLRRTQDDDSSVFSIDVLKLDNTKHKVTVENQPIELTFKEYELLLYLMRHQGQVLSREMIMNRVWSTDYEGESRTLDMHIKTLRHKLGNAGNKIRTIRNVGYVIE